MIIEFRGAGFVTEGVFIIEFRVLGFIVEEGVRQLKATLNPEISTLNPKP